MDERVTMTIRHKMCLKLNVLESGMYRKLRFYSTELNASITFMKDVEIQNSAQQKHETPHQVRTAHNPTNCLDMNGVNGKHERSQKWNFPIR